VIDRPSSASHQAEPPPLRIEALGGLRVEAGGTEVVELPSQPVRCALLVYLAVERRATRDELTALCWPERSAERARHSLSQALYELRRQLGDGWLVSAGEQLEVADAVHVDVVAFESEVQDGRDDDALALFAGPLLAGVHLGAGTAFESWATRRSAQLARLFRTACRRACDAKQQAGDVAAALDVAQRWAHHEPLDDEAHHRLVELLALAGRRAEALRCYDDYAERIARELDVRPLDETQQLVAGIRDAGSARSPALTAVPAAATSPATAHDVMPPSDVASAAYAASPDAQVADGIARRVPRRTRLIAAASLALLALSTAAYLGVRGGARDGAPAERAGRTTAAAPPTGAAAGLAVLPFANLSADPEQEYFVDGVAEDLLTSLSRVDGLRVISRTSAWRYKGSDLALGDIAGELGVAWILEGSVRRDGDRVRITAQLIDAATDAHVWAETYERELTGIFELQSELAEQIAAALLARIAPGAAVAAFAGGAGAAGAASPAELAAYDLLLRGLAYLNRPGEGDVRKFDPAMAYFREALQLAPGYARAHAALSEAFRTHVGLPLPLRRDSSYAHARRAVALDPSLAEARALLGWAYVVRRELDRADAELKQAVALDPNQVDALAGLARLAWIHGRIDDAVRWQRRAVAVDPGAPTQQSWLGSFYMDLGDAAAAERAFSRAAGMAPDAPAPAYALAQLALLRGDGEAADRAMARLAEAATGHPGADFLLGRYHGQRGRLELGAPLLDRAAERLTGAVATTALQRAWFAQRLERPAEAATLLAMADRELDALESAGFHAPRLRMHLAALRGDAAGATAVLRRWWRYELGGDLAAGPQIGLYWIDADPLLAQVRTDPAFRTLLAEIRAELDAMRSQLAADPEGDVGHD
jgi:TolB-like protein/DNA-binding SARP family transcriptional activator/Flp pilus assembly protein TadD